MGRRWVKKTAESAARWTIGHTTILKVPELVLEAGLEEDDAHDEGFLPEGTSGELLKIEWLRPDFVTEQGAIRLSFHALVIDTGLRRVVVDTCVGNHKHRPDQPFWEMLKLPFLDTLAECGYPRESIDIVINTHLHVDHVGWNTMMVDGRWEPTFPNARYLISKADFEHCQQQRMNGTSAQGFMPDEVYEDSVAPIIECDLATFVPPDYRVCDEIMLIPTAGHTPGHVSVMVSSGGQRALITGDTFHHPSQIVHPDWTMRADHNAQAALATRQALLANLVDSDVLLIGTHWSGCSSGRLRSFGEAIRLERHGLAARSSCRT